MRTPLDSPSLRMKVLALTCGALLSSGCSSGGGGGGGGGGGTSCDLSTATAVTKQGQLSASETWPSGLYHLTSTVTVPSGSTLTIAACTKLQLDANVNLDVNGALVVAGTASQPVSFERATPASPWGAVAVNFGATADLSYLTLTGGGGSTPQATSDTLGAPLYVRASGGPPVPTPLKANHLTVEGATGVGIGLINAGFAAGSSALTVHGSGGHALYLGAHALGTLPSGTFTGNHVDAIALQTAYYAVQDNQRAITSDLTIPNVGVPYDVGLSEASTITIGTDGSTVPLVTIAPGVTLRFRKGSSAAGWLLVQSDGPFKTAYGALRAVGTDAQPIVFTSAEASPKAGDWVGVRLRAYDSRTRLEHVRIEYAGADSTTSAGCVTYNDGFDADAALQVLTADAPPLFLVNSTISDSASSGIYRGWVGADVDFTAGNTLTHIPWCAQTPVKPTTGTCPKSCQAVP